jgi:hypothetical protein
MATNKDESDLERLRILVSDGKGHRPLPWVVASLILFGLGLTVAWWLGWLAWAALQPEASSRW